MGVYEGNEHYSDEEAASFYEHFKLEEMMSCMDLRIPRTFNTYFVHINPE